MSPINHGRPAAAEAHLEDLRARARYARERYDLYKAKAYGPRLTSAGRMRELKREFEQADARLRAAQADQPTPPSGGDTSA